MPGWLRPPPLRAGVIERPRPGEPPRTADGGAADRRCGAHGLRKDDPSRLLGRLDAAPGGVGFRRIAGARRRRLLGSRCGRTRAGGAEAAPRPALRQRCRRTARADGDGCRPALRRADSGAGRIRAGEPRPVSTRISGGSSILRRRRCTSSCPLAASPSSHCRSDGPAGRPRSSGLPTSASTATRQRPCCGPLLGPLRRTWMRRRRPTHRGMARWRLSRGPRGAGRAGAGRGARRLLRCGAGRLRLSPPRAARRAAGRDAPVVLARDLGARAAQCGSVRRLAPAA